MEEVDLKRFIIENLFIKDGSKLNPRRTNLAYMHSKFPDQLEAIKKRTSFLKKDASIVQRIRTILAGIKVNPTCLCGNPVSFNASTGKYREFCSPYCEDSKEELIARIESTSYRRYGTNVPAKSAEIKKKLQTIVNQRSKDWYERSREKSRKTCLDRYGFSNPMQSPDIRERHSKSHLTRTGYKNPSQNPITIEKRRRRSLKEHGVPSAKQRNLSPKLKSLLKDENRLKDLLQSLHYCEYKSLTEIAKDLDTSPYLISDYCKKLNIKVKYYYRSSAEKEVAEFIESIIGKEAVFTNERGIITPLELDILIPGHKVAIEYHGLYWHSFDRLETAEEKDYSSFKTRECRKVGIQLFTIFEDEWVDPVKQRIWKSILRIRLGKKDTYTKVYARQCQVLSVGAREARNFYSNNHLQGFTSASIHLGLYREGTLLSMMSFKRNGTRYELVRFCSDIGTAVVGGASKLFKHFERNFKFDLVYTFADLRYTRGNVYSVLGFTRDSEVKPRYYYTKGGKIFHRRGFQKKYLKELLGDLYDNSMTESQLVFNFTDFRRIWDCGKVKFIYKVDDKE